MAEDWKWLETTEVSKDRRKAEKAAEYLPQPPVTPKAKKALKEQGRGRGFTRKMEESIE